MTGAKGEIELEWTPKGQNETVDKYLRNLPPELLPVKGSAAAQERKQLLQKQIPIHDIDPTLCHELTDAELKQMNEYIAHVKQDSVGTGHLIELQLIKNAINSQAVKLQGANKASSLKNKLQNLSINERKQLKIPEDSQQSVHMPTTNDLRYPTNSNNQKTQLRNVNYGTDNRNLHNLRENIPNIPPTLLESNQNPTNANGNRIRDVYAENNVNYTNLANESEKSDPMSKHADKTLPHYAPSNYSRFNETRTPQKIGNIRDLAFSTYDPSRINSETFENNCNVPSNTENVSTASAVGLSKNLPRNYSPNRFNVEENVQDPSNVNIGSINDICYPVNEIKMAEQINNDIFEGGNHGYGISNPSVLSKLLVCHR